jgi:hypothetical protein
VRVEHTDHPARVRDVLGGDEVRTGCGARARGAGPRARYPTVIVKRIGGTSCEPRSERDRYADEQMSGLCHDDPFQG